MATTTTPTTPDDLESALEIIESNGGVGEWETPTDTVTPRWLFPRFKGADLIGTCSTEGDVPKGHEGIHTKKKGCGSDFAADPGNMYLSRAGVGPFDTDVETIVSWLEAPRTLVGAILLLGDPGTGKTALAEAAVTHLGREMTTVVCTPDHTKDALFLRFVGEGNGDVGINGVPTPFTLGPFPYAAKHGHVLYADEVMLLNDGLKPVLYALSDGRRYLPEGNVDGSPLEIHPDFRLVLSSNPLVRGASLPEPLASRCASTTITVETSAEMLRDLDIAEEVVETWEALKSQNLWTPQIREMRLADYWLPVNPAQAASAMVPEHAPESQREAITNTVISMLGGGRSLTKFGRLVVS